MVTIESRLWCYRSVSESLIDYWHGCYIHYNFFWGFLMFPGELMQFVMEYIFLNTSIVSCIWESTDSVSPWILRISLILFLIH
jgi:hypothetical protein